ncbi:SDR family NAD(P)-dependent oxidoreductase [Rhodanobacter lindaniclasticus]
MPPSTAPRRRGAGIGAAACIGGVDRADPATTASALDTAAKAMGGLDALVNIAGTFRYETVADGHADTWDLLYRVNLRTAVAASQAALPHLRAGGRIIDVGAASALKAGAGVAAYTASKSGVMRFTESLAEELKERDITVNALLPSILDTPPNRADMPKADFSRWVKPAQTRRRDRVPAVEAIERDHRRADPGDRTRVIPLRRSSGLPPLQPFTATSMPNPSAADQANARAESFRTGFSGRPMREYKGLPIYAAPGLHEAAAELLASAAPTNARVLEFGAGSGAMSLRLADLGFRVTASDLFPESFKPTEVPFVAADLNGAFAAQWPQGFDAVMALEIIKHLENPREVLRQIRALLPVGGQLVLSTPNIANPVSQALFLRTGPVPVVPRRRLPRAGPHHPAQPVGAGKGAAGSRLHPPRRTRRIQPVPPPPPTRLGRAPARATVRPARRPARLAPRRGVAGAGGGGLTPASRRPGRTAGSRQCSGGAAGAAARRAKDAHGSSPTTPLPSRNRGSLPPQRCCRGTSREKPSSPQMHQYGTRSGGQPSQRLCATQRHQYVDPDGIHHGHQQAQLGMCHQDDDQQHTQRANQAPAPRRSGSITRSHVQLVSTRTVVDDAMRAPAPRRPASIALATLARRQQHAHADQRGDRAQHEDHRLAGGGQLRRRQRAADPVDADRIGERHQDRRRHADRQRVPDAAAPLAADERASRPPAMAAARNSHGGVNTTVAGWETTPASATLTLVEPLESERRRAVAMPWASSFT